MAALIPFLYQFRERLGAFVDQGLQGLANLLFLAILAKGLSPALVASVGTMIGIFYLFFSLHRGGLVLPYILLEDATDRSNDNCWFTLNLIAALLCSATIGILALFSLSFHAYADVIPTALRFAAVVTPAWLLAEFGRRRLYKHDKPIMAALASAFYLLSGTLTASAAVLWHSATLGGLTYLFAALGSLLVSFVAAPVRPEYPGRAYAVWAPHREQAIWQALSGIPVCIYFTSVVVLIAQTGSALATALFTVTRAIVSPAMAVVSAIDSIDKPRAARAFQTCGLVALRQQSNATRKLIIMSAGGYLLFVAVFAQWLLGVVGNDMYEPHGVSVRILCVGFLLACLIQPWETALVILRGAKRLLVARLLTAILTIAACSTWKNADLSTISMHFSGLQLFYAVSLFLILSLEYDARRRDV